MRERQCLFDVESAHLLGVGRIHPDPGWAMSVHAHTNWEFIYFLRGSGRVDVPQATLRPQQYYLVVYPPGLPHAEVSDPVNPEETIHLMVDVPGNSPPGAHLLLPDSKGEIGWLCQRVFNEYMASGITPLALTYTRAFLYLVERVWGCGIPVQHDLVDLAVQYIHSNYCADMSLDELSSAACTSKTHLAHRFTARLGISPLRYLQNVRVEAAKRLLATTSIPVSEIAAQVGFSDPLYFSRVLKLATGLSPKAFRQQSNCASQSIYFAIQSIASTDALEV